MSLPSVLFSLGVAICLFDLIIQSNSQSPGEVRLVNSSAANEGRVEVFHNGTWGTICDNSWDINDGQVVCRQLGYPGAMFVYSYAYYGRGTGEIWLTAVYCRGTENNLTSCSHSRWSGYSWQRSYCGHDRDAGVACHNKTDPGRDRGGSCTFEIGTDLCGYTNMYSGYRSWSLQRSYYYAYYHAPTSDHTYGNSGHYIIIKTNYYYYGMSKMGRIISPQITGGRCLKFYHHMKGSNIAQLNVYVKSGKNTPLNGTLLWQQVGGQYSYSTWMMVMVPIEGFTTFKIIFEAGIAGSSSYYGGDIAVDDIEILNDTCILANSGNCSFDNGNLCGYTNAKDDNFDWTLHAGRTQNYYATGPKKDHTTGKGNYIYIRTSSLAGVAGLIARFVSPEIYDCKCVEFYYHMKGYTIGELNVFIDDGVAKKLVWQLIGEQSSDWSKAMIPVKDLKAFKIVFEGVSGSDYRGNIAIDDIIAHPSTCVVHPSSASVALPDIRNISHNVRLAGGNVSSAGRIEVLHKGRWGTVCGSSFPLTSARVVCKELGFIDAEMLVPCCSLFRKGKGRIQLDDVRCRGDEPAISMCSHKGWGISTCSHDQDVSVICRTNVRVHDVRLSNSSNDFEGRVEVKIGGIWGSVSDGGWDIWDADVFCRQVGFAGATSSYNSAHYGRGSGPVWITYVGCSGDEVSLWNCNITLNKNPQVHSYSWWNPHQKDAGAVCYDLRLTGGRNNSQGIVEIRHSGTWGTVCNDGWDMNDAQVVCRQLGYTRAVSLRLGYFALPSVGAMPVLTRLKCRGTESSIGLCPYQVLKFVQHQCNHFKDAQVVCAGHVNGLVEIHFLKLRKEEWVLIQFKKSVADQVNDYCKKHRCGILKGQFRPRDVLILKDYPKMSHDHLIVRLKMFYPGSHRIFPNYIIYEMVKEQGNVAGYSVVSSSVVPPTNTVYPKPQARKSAGLNKQMTIIVVVTALVALAIGAVLISVLIYRKKKAATASSVHYRVLNMTPDANDDDVNDDSLLSLRHDEDTVPLLI